MTVLAIGILALFAMFESGIRHLTRASTITTAGALADQRDGELPRDQVRERSASRRASSRHWHPTPCTRATRRGSRTPLNRVDLVACGTVAVHDEGAGADADGRGRQELPRRHVRHMADRGRGPQVKLVTIVVRDGTDTTKVWARTASAFDRSTGE